MNTTNIGVSVILCCYNSAKRLPETLKHIALQNLPDDLPVEVVLVDNASDDTTSKTAIEEWQKYTSSIKLRIVTELKPGLINARIKGIEQSKYEIIIFCDDDNWLLENYIRNAWDIMMRNNNIGALGGEGIPVSNISFPDWFEEYKNSYACGKQWHINGICTSRKYLWGAGLVTRLSIMKKVFSPTHPMLLTGRKEGVLLAGDDYEICRRIVMLNYDLFYSNNLKYKHFIDEKRLDLNYYNKIKKGFAISYDIIKLYTYVDFRCRHSDFKFILILVFNTIIGLLNRTRLLNIKKTWNLRSYIQIYRTGINKKGKYHTYYSQIEWFCKNMKAHHYHPANSM
ncbi:glycosyltransferase [uncultured Draconibacterium sp.]|uniref:glycosyltransferase n=1 Tax=uncultured Draconibacterium sp. TaxID=1573823 RepID=UPI0029C79BAC|nr:glycosyltransferase [uncultured Draconibacterium sp.]